MDFCFVLCISSQEEKVSNNVRVASDIESLIDFIIDEFDGFINEEGIIPTSGISKENLNALGKSFAEMMFHPVDEPVCCVLETYKGSQDRRFDLTISRGTFL